MPETFVAGTVVIYLRATGYQVACDTCGRARVKETKAYPILHKPTDSTNWGLPKRESQKAMAKGSEYPAGQRSSRSSPGAVTPSTWRRGTVTAYQNQQ